MSLPLPSLVHLLQTVSAKGTAAYDSQSTQHLQLKWKVWGGGRMRTRVSQEQNIALYRLWTAHNDFTLNRREQAAIIAWLKMKDQWKLMKSIHNVPNYLSHKMFPTAIEPMQCSVLLVRKDRAGFLLKVTEGMLLMSTWGGRGPGYSKGKDLA